MGKGDLAQMKRIPWNSQYLFVIRELVAREVKRKYSRSRLGILWSVLSPLLSMAVLSLIFSTMFRKSIEHYPVYYLTGLILWNFFTAATNTAMTSLVDNKSLLLQARFPRSVFPISRVTAALVNLMYSLVAYALILLIFGIRPGITMMVFPLIVFLTALAAMGVGYLLSVLYVSFGDIRHLYSVVLTLWMYLSALFYPLDLLPEGVQKLIQVNPIFCYITAARDCMMYGRFPSVNLWLRMIFWSLDLYLIGWIVFRKKERYVIQSL